MKDFTTRQEATQFFEILSEADYIFFANQCFKFANYCYDVENKNKNLKNQNEDLLAIKKELEEKIKSFEEEKKNLEHTHEVEKNRYENRLKNQIIEVKNEEEQKWKKYFEDRIEKKANEISHLEAQLFTDSQLKKEFEIVLKQLDNRSKKFTDDAIQLVKKPEKSQEIGAEGERIVEETLNEYPFLKFEKITKHHMGDFHVGFRDSNVKVMIEVKNYKNGNSIPEEEINKFIKDLNENSGVHCGLLLAMKTKFANKYQEYKVYKTKQGKPYIMINNLLARTHYEIPLLFGLSAIQMLVESRSIRGEEATKVVEKCIKQWSELLKSAMTMERSAKKIKSEAEKVTAKIKGGMEYTKRSLEILKEKAMKPVEESSLTSNLSDPVPPPTKKQRIDEQ